MATAVVRIQREPQRRLPEVVLQHAAEIADADDAHAADDHELEPGAVPHRADEGHQPAPAAAPPQKVQLQVENNKEAQSCLAFSLSLINVALEYHAEQRVQSLEGFEPQRIQSLFTVARDTGLARHFGLFPRALTDRVVQVVADYFRHQPQRIPSDCARRYRWAVRALIEAGRKSLKAFLRGKEHVQVTGQPERALGNPGLRRRLFRPAAESPRPARDGARCVFFAPPQTISISVNLS
jgi:hypothetical protein